MERVRVDWHIHTTLSPCGSLAMDPLTILERAKQKGLQVIGITDHNSTRQAKIIKEEYTEEIPLILTGAEVTTREEIHCLVFFDGFVALDEFQSYLDAHLPAIPNRPDYFGDQVVVNSKGEIIFEEEKLLISALDQSLEQVEKFVSERGGIFIPAHINRPSYSLLSQLGMIPSNLKADALEWIPAFRGGLDCESDPAFHSFPLVCSSDAHYPDDIGCRYTELEVEGWSFDNIKSGLSRLMKMEA